MRIFGLFLCISVFDQLYISLMKRFYFSTSLSSKYTSRTNSGEIVFPYKSDVLKANSEFEGSLLEIKRLNSVDIPRYMNFDLVEALDYADEVVDQIGNILMKKYHMDDVMPVRYKHPVIILSSILLEASDED